MIAYSKAAVLAVSAGLALTACGRDQPPASEVSTPHGYVDGAEEVAEVQSRLVLADAETGAVRVLDLLTEEITRLDDVAEVDSVHTDGRFAYLVTGESTRVLDGGSWTVDHGDHVHYYRAQIRRAGEIDGRAVAAHADSSVTAVAQEEGTTALLDRHALEDGRTEPGAPVDGLAVPYEQHLVVATDDGVSVRTRDGDPAATIDQPCPAPSGTAVTRRGVVVGCADGALLVHEDDGEFDGVRIAYPRGLSGSSRATAFTHRPGSATLTAPAGERGVLVLDAAERHARLFETGPVVAVNTVGGGGPVLALTADGVLHAYDHATGEEVASAALLPGGVPEGAAPSIQVDTSRAYVNDPDRRRVYEIDYNDELRLARAFDLDITPSYVVETGR
ncbi:hypothetical protein [Saccharomonospora saliphila]|uniref:hypothetical protein n=1 Tax=Saccharomonospora saliphila TaxID=369829 RepID=UPI00036D3418|nr:hypothetical protein [Saccharomonospora saliphila]